MNNEHYLMDLERTIGTGIATYWKPNKRGYTRNIKEAGLYDRNQAQGIVNEDIDKRTVVIDCQVVDNIL